MTSGFAVYAAGLGAAVGLLWPLGSREVLALLLLQIGMMLLHIDEVGRARAAVVDRLGLPYRWVCPACPLAIESNDAVYVARWSEQHQARHS